MRLSDSGLLFIANEEGFRSNLYNDAGNNATIGFGHLVHRGPINGSESAEFKSGISKDAGLTLLRLDTGVAEDAVNSAVTTTLLQNQFDALVDLTYNIGAEGFKNSSALMFINSGEMNHVPFAIMQYCHSNGKALAGLFMRRAREAVAFL